MLQRSFATGIVFLCLHFCYAQTAATLPDSTQQTPKPKTTIAGFADCYYRYDIDGMLENNKTSFTNSHNSFELGMVSARFDHQFGKAALAADVGFGKRAEDFSYADDRTRFIIKQLFLSYTFKKDIKVTAGSWATHVGYELVDAYSNRNYSMSYMFSYGPFFHTGVKVEKAFGPIGVMIGLANPTDLKTASFSNKYVIGQLSAASADQKTKVYLNFQGGKSSDSSQVAQVDFVATYALHPKFSLGYNGTVARFQLDPAGDLPATSSQWWGSALYLNYDPAAWLGISLRSEYFSDKDQLNVFAAAPGGGSIFANTLSFNLRKDQLALIPEVRYEQASNSLFSGGTSDHALSFLCAAVYKF